MLTPPRALCAPPLTQEGRTTKQFMLSLFLSLVSAFSFCSCSCFCFNLESLIPLFGEEGDMPERHGGSSQLHKCLVVDVDFVFAVGGGPLRGVAFLLGYISFFSCAELVLSLSKGLSKHGQAKRRKYGLSFKKRKLQFQA